jgi:hypothetical protein
MMLKNLRGYNVQYATYKTRQRERGLDGPPNTLDVIRGDPSTELDYEQFCTALEQAGVNWLRVKIVGRNNPQGGLVCAFEPPPAGTYNLWNIVLDPASLAQYRSHQVTLPIDRATWSASNLGQFILACKRHGVRLNVIPFHNGEFGDKWSLHAWNRNNNYVNGTRCQEQDRGFISDHRAALTDPRAIQAAKDRIDAILGAFAGYEDVIASWEACAEITNIANPRWAGTDGWNDEFRQWIHKMRDWLGEIARHIQSQHLAPVGASQATEGSLRNGSWKTELFDSPALDWVGINSYGLGLQDAYALLRMAQARYPGKQIVTQQYAPWQLGSGIHHHEDSPYRQSKRLEWLFACGNGGFIGPMRWPDMDTGTYASPRMAEIAGITAQMASAADLDNWSTGQSWDARMSSPDLSLVSSWGDGQHVTAFLRWSTDGQKPIAIQGLADGEYTVRWFDWLDGDEVRAQAVTVSGGTLALDTAITRDRFASLCVIPLGSPLPEGDLEQRVTALEARLGQIETAQAKTEADVIDINDRLAAAGALLAGG